MQQETEKQSSKLLMTLFLAFFLIGLPLGSWYYLQTGMEDRLETMDLLDNNYGELPAFVAVNQYGDTITEADFRGNMVMVDFFFTRCNLTCPPMMRNMVDVNDQFSDRDDIKIISFTVDPENDTTNLLRQFSQDLGLRNNNRKWYLANLGSTTETVRIAQEHFKLPTDEADGDNTILHSRYIALVDTAGVIRNYYDGTTDEGVSRLVKHTAFLMPIEGKSKVVYDPETEK